MPKVTIKLPSIQERLANAQKANPGCTTLAHPLVAERTKAYLEALASGSCPGIRKRDVHAMILADVAEARKQDDSIPPYTTKADSWSSHCRQHFPELWLRAFP